ncbi:MAG: tetratricopeptide repeat protein [Ignavibacteriaceae bacterium]
MKIFSLKEKDHLVYKKSKHKKGRDANQLPLFQGRVIKLQNKSYFDEALERDLAGDPEAYSYYLKSIEENENIDESYNNLAILEVPDNKIKAFGYFLKAIKYNPSHCEAHFNIANLYFEEKDFALAKLHYEIAAEIDPSFPNIYYNLALVCIEMNEVETAETCLKKYILLVGKSNAADAADIVNYLHSVKQS